MISKQNRSIRYTVIREAAGLSYGKNHWDLLDPEHVKTLAHVIGKAGVNTGTYAPFLGVRFEDELTNRAMALGTGQEIIFVHRGLLGLPAHLIVEKFTAMWPDRIPRSRD
jgi:hypothetical protein